MFTELGAVFGEQVDIVAEHEVAAVRAQRAIEHVCDIGEISKGVQVPGQHRDRVFALLRDREHLLDRIVGRPLFIGDLGLEFQRDVAAKAEPPGLGRLALEHGVEQAPLFVQAAKCGVLDCSH